jgi:hypothetical protein
MRNSVVIAVNTPDGGALRACRNLLQAAEEPVLAELVCYGPVSMPRWPMARTHRTCGRCSPPV